MTAPTRTSPLVLLAALVLVTGAPARAADTWTDPEPGLRHLHRTLSGPVSVDAVLVDLCDPSIDFRATRSVERQKTPSNWGTSVGARAAINGDFFNYTGYAPIGLAVGAGEVWPGTYDGTGWALFAAGSQGKVDIRQAAESLGSSPESWMREIVGGSPNCLINGVPQFDTDSHYDERHPRSAVGISQDRRTLILAVVDGRSTLSRGVTTQELGQILRDLGAWNGLNFDGGGSSALWLAAEGVVNNPSDGTQRVVSNHLGVMRSQVPAGEPSRCCTPAPVAGASGTFDDVEDSHWAFSSIEALYAAGGTNGCSANPPLFCPGCRASRAAVVTMIVRVAGWSLVRPASPSFSDVPASHALYAEIETAAAHGVTLGCGGGRFCPDDPTSRAALAVFIARAFGFSTTAPSSAAFSDVPASDPAAGAIQSMVDNCVTNGCGAGLFCPLKSATRAETATFLARAARLVPTGCDAPDAGFPQDAGTLPYDAGSQPYDAGSQPYDAGTLPHDAGTVPYDAGTVPYDAGTVPYDAGTVPYDAGTVPYDAGTLPHDAGSVSQDSGTPPTDAGLGWPDAGAAEDTGDGRATASVEIGGGCGCSSTPPAAGVLFAAVLTLVFVPRRRFAGR